MATLSRRVRFADFELDVSSGQLLKRGLRVPLRDQAVEVLTVLLLHRGDLVTREELQRRLWPQDVFVDFDNNINTAIARLREVLSDSAQTPRFIETLPKRGYRFIAPVSEVAEAVPRSNRTPRVLVLPLLNLGADPSQEYFSDAMTEEIITALAGMAPARLSVIARTTAMHYKGSHQDAGSIGRELSVDYIVEGSVRLVEDGLAVNLQLIRVSDQSHVWANRYEARAEEVFRIQREAAEVITAHIDPASQSAMQAPPVPRKPTEDLAAYNLYLQGRYHLNKWSPEGFLRAKQCFEQATERDPRFALAYDALAELYWNTGFFGFAPPKEAFSTGIFAAIRAVEMDPTLGETHALIAMYRKELDYNWIEVARGMKRALELNPASPVVHLRYALSGLMPQGRMDESAAELDRALESDPLSLFTRWWLAIALWLGRQYDRGIGQARQIIDLSESFYLAHFAMAMNLLDKGEFDQAVQAQRGACELSGGSPLMLGWLGLALARSGNTLEARAILDRLESIGARMYVPPSGFAWIHFALGEIDAGFEWLNRSVDLRDPVIIPIKTYPFLDPIRADPRYRAILDRMHLEP